MCVLGGVNTLCPKNWLLGLTAGGYATVSLALYCFEHAQALLFLVSQLKFKANDGEPAESRPPCARIAARISPEESLMKFHRARTPF